MMKRMIVRVGGLFGLLLALVVCHGASSPSIENKAINILADNGFNYARIRLLIDPPMTHGLYQNEEYVIQTALAAQNQGMDILIDLFYSDWWADPGQNKIPKAWSEIDRIEALEKRLYLYTKETLLRLSKAGVKIGMVQVGNEVNPGMCLELGRIENGQWGNFVRLTNAGYRAVKETLPGAQVMIHYAGVGDGAMGWFEAYEKNGGRMDVLGISFYEMWHGKIEVAVATVEALHERFERTVFIAETAAYWKKSEGAYETFYSQNRKGQYDFLFDLTNAVSGIEGLGGVFYWGATWTQASRWLEAPGWGNDDAGCRGLFDNGGRATLAIKAMSDAGGLSIRGVDVSEALYAESKGVEYMERR